MRSSAKWAGVGLGPLAVLVAVTFSAPVRATENEETPKAGDRQGGGSPSTRGFHGITWNCHSHDDDAIETTPGSPPLVVDDPATPGCNHWEINVVIDGDLSALEKSWELPLLDVNYGVGDNLQLKYEVPDVHLANAEGQTTGIGNSKAGIKFQFYGDDETRLQIAAYPQLQFLTPVVNMGISTPGTSGVIATLPLLLAKRVGQVNGGNLMMSVNAGYRLSSREDSSSFFTGAVALGAPFVAKTAILAEIATEQAIQRVAEDSRAQATRADLGLMGTLSEHFAFFASAGRSLTSSDGRVHTYLLGGLRILAGE